MILQSNATGSVALTNGNVVLSGSIIGTGAGPAIFSSGIDLSNTFLMTVNQTNAASGQVLTATDGSGHVAFMASQSGGVTPTFVTTQFGWNSGSGTNIVSVPDTAMSSTPVAGQNQSNYVASVVLSNTLPSTSFVQTNLFTQHGDMLIFDGTNVQRLGRGADGYYLMSSNATAYGASWQPVAASGYSPDSSITNIVIVTNQSTILFHTNNPFPVGNLTTGSGIAWTNLATAGAGFLCEGDVTFTNSHPTDVIQMMITWNSTFKFTNFCNCTTNSGHGGTNSFHIPLSDTNSIIGITNTGPNTIYVSASHIFGHP